MTAALNEIREHAVTDADSLTPVGATLTQGGDAIDGTGLTLQTKLVADDGTLVHDWTGTGASWSDRSAGKVQYDFQTVDTDEFKAAANLAAYWLWFRVLSGGESDTFPVDGRKLRIRVYKAA